MAQFGNKSPDPTWCKETTDSHNLSSDPHVTVLPLTLSNCFFFFASWSRNGENERFEEEGEKESVLKIPDIGETLFYHEMKRASFQKRLFKTMLCSLWGLNDSTSTSLIFNLI